MPRRARKAGQGEIPFPQWGGRRRGAGRKTAGKKACLHHGARPPFAARYPVHVTLRLRAGLPSLRERRAHLVFLGGLVEGAQRAGFRCVEYSAQSNHVHLVCEASGARALGRGIKGLCVRIARRLNRLWHRRGRVFGDRYHARVLRTPSEVRNALAYVLGNAAHHGARYRDGIDPFSSARWFRRGERSGPAGDARSRSPLAEPRTWLLAVGWRRAGSVRTGGQPGPP